MEVEKVLKYFNSEAHSLIVHEVELEHKTK